jgi:uncharacterized protein YbjQ (UPF0145 family)
MLLATTDGLAGWEVDETLGPVAGFASSPDRALDLMETQAEERGATAVVGVRLTTSASGGAFVSDRDAFAYGTAVLARRPGV